MRIEGRTVIVTAGAGSSADLCQQFAAEEAGVVLNDVNEQEGLSVQKEIQNVDRVGRFM